MDGYPKILISACLLGKPVRYDGCRLKDLPALPAPWFSEDRLVVFCPEAAGGLAVPRPPAEIQGGSGKDVMEGRCTVLDRQGQDQTPAFLSGARAALAMARSVGLVVAIFKERSPSCGSRYIYDGTFTGTVRPGQGVTAALLSENGIAVFGEDRIDRACLFLDRLRTLPPGSSGRDKAPPHA